MAFHKYIIGNDTKFYFCSEHAANPAGRGGGPTTLVVHSHGDQLLNTATIATPVAMTFQCADWEYANDDALETQLDAIDGGRDPHREGPVVGVGGQVKNYHVYKYQKAGKAGYLEVQEMIAGRQSFDVVTPRNRLTWKRDKIRVYLSDLFAVLNGVNHSYTRIYCSFCRVFELNDTYRPAGPDPWA